MSSCGMCSRPFQGVCILSFAVGHVVDVFLALTLGKLVSVLEKDNGTSFWPHLLTCIRLRFRQSNGGIGAIRDVNYRIVNAPANF